MGIRPDAGDPRWRARVQAGLENYFKRRSFPRLILGVLVTITGITGMAASIVLLRQGVQQMWIRYPIAVLAGYGVFLGLIRLWVELERSRFDPDPTEVQSGLQTGEQAPFNKSWRSSPDRGSWLDYLDIPDVFDLDEGCVPVLLIGALIGLLALLVFAIAAAPALLSEVFIDAFIVSVLFRRLRIAAREHWLGTAIRRTWWVALSMAGLLSIVGWCLGKLAPGSHSIGPAIHQLFGG